MRAIYKLSNPEQVQRIIRQQEQAGDAEQRLDEALKWRSPLWELRNDILSFEQI